MAVGASFTNGAFRPLMKGPAEGLTLPSGRRSRGAATRAGRTEIVVTEPVHQRSKAALDADIRARRRTALVVNVRSRRGRRHFTTVHRRLQATVEPTRCG